MFFLPQVVVFLLSFIPLPFVVQGLSFKMHSNLPKSIEVLSVCIIDTNDWTIETKAKLLFVILFFFYLNVFSSDDMQHFCILSDVKKRTFSINRLQCFSYCVYYARGHIDFDITIN